MTKTTWYVAINTFSPGQDGYGTVISCHLRLPRAVRACQDVQPTERKSYLPTAVRQSPKRLTGIVRYTDLEPVYGPDLERAEDEVAYDRSQYGR